MLSSEELTRYSRHLNLPQFSIISQKQLREARVLVVGAGGLGTPILLYLAAAGIGHLSIVDHDTVELSNLQRQILYQPGDINKSKADQATEYIRNFNPGINVRAIKQYLTRDNALALINDHDIVVDGSDNFPTRYLLNDACVLSNKPLVYGSIYQYEGQVSVFNALLENNERSANYRDLYPSPPPPNMVSSCETGGVLGVLAGIVGCYQANEVIKLLTGIGEPLVNKILLINSLTNENRIIKYHKNNDTTITQLINYDDFCGVSNKFQTMASNEISVHELQQWRNDGKDFQLIDVREPNEYEFVNIGGELIPLGEIVSSTDKIRTDIDVILMCRSGKRSAAAVDFLKREGINNLYNLRGGILAWAQEIDNSLPQY